MSLEHLLYLTDEKPELFRVLLEKTRGNRSDWEYPFAVAGLNITFMLTELLELRVGPTVGRVPSKPPGRALLRMLGAEEQGAALEEVYCITFELLDLEWLKAGASYMQFNAVMETTKARLTQALSEAAILEPEDVRRALRLP